MSDSERRAAETQALFRLINEKMHDLNIALATITDDAEVVCECADLNCIVQITMPPPAYEELRGHTTPIRGRLGPRGSRLQHGARESRRLRARPLDRCRRATDRLSSLSC